MVEMKLLSDQVWHIEVDKAMNDIARILNRIPG